MRAPAPQRPRKMQERVRMYEEREPFSRFWSQGLSAFSRGAARRVDGAGGLALNGVRGRAVVLAVGDATGATA